MERTSLYWKSNGNLPLFDRETPGFMREPFVSTHPPVGQVVETFLDLSKLEKVRRHPGGKLTARCPACGEFGADRKGDHLVVFPTGEYGCVATSGDLDHSRRIASLIGIRGESRPLPSRFSRPSRLFTSDPDSAKTALSRSAQCHRELLISHWQWPEEEVWHDSPLHPDATVDDPRVFLASLFSPHDLLWTGTVTQSGERYRDRWRILSDWFETPVDELGPMTTPATWLPGTFRRAQNNVEATPYLVLDFDGPVGWRPRDAAEIRRHRTDSLALIRWLREGLGWKLAAILHTGSRSLHAWFHHPGQDPMQSLRDASHPFGIDTGLIGHPEHPCRLPGQRHEKTGGTSRVLWLTAQPEPHHS
jgi:hypothetical protein